MDNFIQPGDVVTLTPTVEVASGEGALVGKIFGVATALVAANKAGEFYTTGVFKLAKLNTSVWVQGQKVYWDEANQRCDGAEVGPCIGTATEAAANPTTTGLVKLNGTVSQHEAIGNLKAATSKNTAGAVTLTIAELLTGVVVADPNGAGRTYTLPTAADLVAGVKGAQIGDVIRCLIVNGADAAETITLAAGTGGDFDANQTAGSRVIPQNASKFVHIRITNVTAASEAYVVYA